MRYQGRLFVTNVDGLRNRILKKAHGFRYSISSGSTDIFHDLRDVVCWEVLKKDIEEFVAKCSNCKHVKAKQQKSGGFIQEIKAPILK